MQVLQEELCTEYKIQDGYRGKWNNIDCGMMGSYVCQTMKGIDTNSAVYSFNIRFR
jgi:hypothetical protein